MNEMVSNEEVEAGLLDQFAFASQQLLLDEKVKCSNLYWSALFKHFQSEKENFTNCIALNPLFKILNTCAGSHSEHSTQSYNTWYTSQD